MNGAIPSLKFVRIGFSKHKGIVGILLALLSGILLLYAGVTGIRVIIFAAAFVLIGFLRFELRTSLTNIYIILWNIGATVVIGVTSQLMLNESYFSLGLFQILLNLALCEVVMCALYAVLGKLRLATIVCFVLILTFTAINYFVYISRGSELAPADFLSIKTAISVIDRYNFCVDEPFGYAVVLGVIYCFVGYLVDTNLDKRSMKRELICVVTTVALVVGIMLGSEDMSALHFLQTGSVANGYLLNFYLQLQETFPQKPSEYSYDTLANLEKIYLDIHDDVNAPERYPDIIVVMNESFVDLSVLGDNVQTNQEITPFLDSLDENVIRGYALSSVFGGGTPNSEFEFLTGNSMGFLPSGSIAYQQFINDDTYSLISHLNQLGYSTMVTHPQAGENWLRYLRYENFGIDEMHFLDDYPQTNLMRGYVSDLEMYEQMIEWYEEAICSGNQTPVFYYGITMQNHGSYTYSGQDFVAEVQLSGELEGKYFDVEQYLTLVHSSDKALEYLIHYFEAVERDVIVLFYGDHFPNLDSDFLCEAYGGTFDTLDDELLKYYVPFVIWANYDIDDKYVPLTSINFLSNYLLEAAGINKSPYQMFISDVEKVIPAMNSLGYYSNTRKCFVTYAEADDEEATWIEKYKILQYNYLFDEKRSKMFTYR